MKKLTLSFDNGPSPNVTPNVLDVLAMFDVKATFFVCGQKLLDPAAKEIAARARALGHWIGNHTFTHTIPLGNTIGPMVAEVEIGRTQELIGALSYPDKLFRPFGGGGAIGKHLLSPASHQFLQEGGYTCVLWNSVPRDWEDPDGWVKRALDDCDNQAWTLVVLHDLDTGAMDYLDMFLQRLLAKHVEIVQNFPPDCVPMRSGEVLLPMDNYVSDQK